MNLSSHHRRAAILWHPRQRLWNRNLVRAIEASVPGAAATWLVRTVVLADTLLLFARVARRRVERLGVRRALAPSRRSVADVLYLDCGVHEQGDELRLVRRWFGDRRNVRIIAFEPGRRQFDAACASLADVPGLDLRREALVGPDHEGATVTLHCSDGGYADSILAGGGSKHEEAPAARLSAVLLAEHPGHDGPVVLRMNIEGAELAVVEDLVAAGLDGRIDGWYGLWDDVARIDPALGARFDRLLGDRAITPLTFNGRDVGYALRRLAIRLDLATSIRHGELRGPRRIDEQRAEGDDRVGGRA